MLDLKLFEEFPRRSFAKDEIVIREGEITESLFVLVSGKLQILKEALLISEISHQGSTFGEVSVLLGREATASVVAFEYSELIEVPEPEKVMKQNPELLFEVSRLLARRINWLTEKYAKEMGDWGSSYWKSV